MKQYTGLVLLLLAVAVPVLYNSCASDHGEASFNSSANMKGMEACMPALIDAFRPYHNVLKNKCGACHFSGGTGNGAFADNNVALAVQIFHKDPGFGMNGKGEEMVYTFATDPNHKPPSTGPANAGLLDPLRQPFNNAAGDFRTCMASQNTGGGGGGGGSNVPLPNRYTINKTINPTNNVQTVEFNLATELSGASIAGARVRVDYRLGRTAEGDLGSDALFISNLRVIGGPAGVHVQGAGIKLNGSVVTGSPGTTWHQINRIIPANRLRFANDNSSAMVVEGSNFSTLAVGFGTITEAPLVGGEVFNPPTYQQLMANGGLFQSRCVACHTNNGPFSFPAAQNNTAFLLFKLNYARPFDPDSSLVFIRTQDNSMPQGGPALTPQEKAQIEQWLVDGALLNEPQQN